MEFNSATCDCHEETADVFSGISEFASNDQWNLYCLNHRCH